MLDGWRNQQLARNLAFSTISGREKVVDAFARSADTWPWHWSAQLVDEWLGDLRSVRNLKRSTLRTYQEAVRSFCAYIIDPAYQWSTECEQRFGTHPVQVVHEWNTAVHVADAVADAGKRAFTRNELIALFDHTDEQVARIRGAGRKGWLPAFRDAVLLAVPRQTRRTTPPPHDLGVPAAATRTAALRQLVIQAPAPVVADALGYHNKHLTRVLANAGGTWKTYAPGDHSR